MSTDDPAPDSRSERPATDGDAEADVDRVKATLGHLARPDGGAVVDRAAAAVDDLDAACAFLEAVGLEELAVAVERTDDPERRRRGERALEAFRRFRAAAASEAECADPNYFHPGRGTDLRSGVEGPDR